MTKVTIGDDDPENDENPIVVRANAEVRVAGRKLEPGARYSVDPEADGVREAIMLEHIDKLRKKD